MKNRWYVYRYDTQDHGVLVADRRNRATAEEVARVFQQASDAKGESYVYVVEEVAR